MIQQQPALCLLRLASWMQLLQTPLAVPPVLPVPLLPLVLLRQHIPGSYSLALPSATDTRLHCAQLQSPPDEHVPSNLHRTQLNIRPMMPSRTQHNQLAAGILGCCTLDPPLVLDIAPLREEAALESSSLSPVLLHHMVSYIQRTLPIDSHCTQLAPRKAAYYSHVSQITLGILRRLPEPPW